LLNHGQVAGIISSALVDLEIDGTNRILVLCDNAFRNPNNGDAWYFLSRVPIYEAEFNCRLVIVVDHGKEQVLRSRARFLEYDDYSFEFFTIQATFSDLASIPESEAFRRIVTKRNHSRLSNYFYNLGFGDRENRVVRAPRFPPFDPEPFIEAYDIDPGNTFWIVPHSMWFKPMDIAYWNAVACILRNIGFRVVFNSTDQAFDGTLAFIPWESTVAFAELCGHVIGTRTGFFDFAIIARAQFVIFTPNGYLGEIWNSYSVDNSDGHIKEIPIKGRRNFSDLPELRYFPFINRDFVDYVFRLSLDITRFVIFIVAKDAFCAGSPRIADRRLRVLSLLGLAFDFESSYRWSYYAIIDGGKVVAEEGSYDRDLAFAYNFFDASGSSHVATVRSEGWNVNCSPVTQAEVTIDGIRRCMNRRGLNFVIWDKAHSRCLESVSFDTFLPVAIFETDHLYRIENGHVDDD